MKVFGSFATSITWEIIESLLEDEALAPLLTLQLVLPLHNLKLLPLI